MSEFSGETVRQSWSNAQGQMSASLGTQERDLSRITSTTIRQIRDLDEVTAELRVLADQIYGGEPMPPKQAMPETGIRPVPALMQAADEALNGMDVAIQSLRMVASRFSRL